VARVSGGSEGEARTEMVVTELDMHLMDEGDIVELLDNVGVDLLFRGATQDLLPPSPELS
jgi:hypothetical protein